jgi:16S rRNA (guanine(966)-N(2))-methyltransferase RsmD
VNRKSTLPRQVRIIAGEWKRTPLPVIEAHGLRPTPDRVRETVFNWLEHLQQRQWENRRCLDLFAGTGALGFEAASRGAAKVVMVESNVPACRALQATKEKLGAVQVDIYQGDAASRIASLNGEFDVVFLDPPYDVQSLPVFLPACKRLLTATGLVYIESDQPFATSPLPDWLSGWQLVRSDKAGAVHFALISTE